MLVEIRAPATPRVGVVVVGSSAENGGKVLSINPDLFVAFPHYFFTGFIIVKVSPT